MTLTLDSHIPTFTQLIVSIYQAVSEKRMFEHFRRRTEDRRTPEIRYVY